MGEVNEVSEVINSLIQEREKLQAENAALREIVEAVALVNFGHVYAEFCPFCEKVFYEGEPDQHTADCPITKARALLGKSPE